MGDLDDIEIVSTEADKSTDETRPVNCTKWDEAIKSMTTKDLEPFQAIDTSSQTPREILQDCLVAVNQKKEESLASKWKVTIHGRTIFVRDVLEKMAVWMNRLMAIGDVAVQYDPTSAALPWAAVRLIMQASVNDVETYSYVLEAVENVTSILATCSILELRYLQVMHSRMEIFSQLFKAVTTLYAVILRYLSTILRYYQTNQALRFVKSIVSSKSDFESKFQNIEAARKEVWMLAHLAEAEKTEQILSKISNIHEGLEDLSFFEDALAEIQRPLQQIKSQIDDIHDGLKQETRARILKSISPTPYALHHKAARKNRLKNSGHWLLEKPTFQIWRYRTGSTVLWLHGIPGSGKTKLTSMVIDELSQTDNLAFFYCMRNPAEPDRARGDKIISSLVRQFASPGPDRSILPPVMKEYEEAIAGLIEFEDLAWTVDEGANVLLGLLQEYPSATIVLDALDEVDQDDRQELMDIMGRLLSGTANLKVFISSRDNYDIAMHLADSPNVYIEADDNAGDIASFIDDQLTKARLLHGKLPDDLRSDIVDTLLNGARGMFRWVDLQIQSLRHYKLAADIKARLGTLPITLEESYWEIFQGIQQSGDHAMDLALFTFKWLLYAKSQILVDEFAAIASKTLESDYVSSFTGNDVIDVCSNLVVAKEDHFELAHLSVREFLEGLPKRRVESLLPEKSNADLACACLRFMDTWASQWINDEFGSSALSRAVLTPLPELIESEENKLAEAPQLGNTDETDSERSSSPPPPQDVVDDIAPGSGFYEKIQHRTYRQSIKYATKSWVDHANEAKSLRETEPLISLIKQFFIDDTLQHVSDRFQVWCFLVNACMDEDEFLDYAKFPANPIWVACMNDWFDMVQFLYGIKNPAVNQRQGDAYRENGKKPRTPLWYAIEKHNIPLAQCLVQNQTTMATLSLDRLAKMKESPLVEVVRNHDEDMSKVLMQYSSSEVRTDAFIEAASHGYCDLLDVLMEEDPSVVTQGGYAALKQACLSGHADAAALVSRLLSPEKFIEDSSFYITVMRNHADVIRVLLEKGINKNVMSNGLVIAVGNGDEGSQCASLLLEYGAQKDPMAVIQSILQGTPLTTVRLIKAGFDITGRHTSKLQTALHSAIEKNQNSVVEALLEKDARIDIRNIDGETALHLASRLGRTRCVQLLLQRGGDILAKDWYGRIPLDLAEMYGNTDVETLVRRQMVKLVQELQEEKERRGGRASVEAEKGVASHLGLSARDL